MWTHLDREASGKADQAGKLVRRAGGRRLVFSATHTEGGLQMDTVPMPNELEREQAEKARAALGAPQRVFVVDLDLGVWQMVLLAIKAVPALIVAGVALAFATVVLGRVFAGLIEQAFR
jgi:hypothetical protein